MRVRRPLLGFVLGAIAVTAALGLYAVLVPDFGDLQAKILGTSASISVASILVLACAPAWERRLVSPVPALGAGLTIFSLVLIVFGMWSENEHETYWKIMGTALMLAVWAVLASLLALAVLPARYRWTFVAALGFTLALALVGVGAMWNDGASSAGGKAAGALAVLSAAFVLAVPVLSRASRGEVVDEEKLAGGDGFCPRCGASVGDAGAEEPVTCVRCGARFRVAYEE